MKRTFSFRNALALALAFCLALAAIPASALPRFDVKAEVTPAWTVPNGYNVHDYTKCVTFLEQTDENGVKNGEQLSESYDPNDPETWGEDEDWADLTWDCPYPEIRPCFIWESVNGEQRIKDINVGGHDLTGPIDVSGCIELRRLNCANCGLTELDLSSNTELGALRCSYNSLAELDLSNNTSLGRLECSYNNLTELDLSNSNLSSLKCVGNRLTELDLSNSSFFATSSIKIKAEGNGYIGFKDYFYSLHSYGVYLYAYPANGVYGPGFEGFYLDNGELISHGWYSEWDEAYIYCYGDGGKGSERWLSGSTFIARFSDELPYNAHDFEKCRAFLEQTDENGVKNGEKLSETYDPNDPETWGRFSWGTEHFQWTTVNGEKRVSSIMVGGFDLYGGLDVSGCTALDYLYCAYNNLTELDVTGCAALYWLDCSNNNITALHSLSAYEYLNCLNNNFTELNMSNLMYSGRIVTDGNGYIGFFFKYYEEDAVGPGPMIGAKPRNGASFEGFYNESGELVAAGAWNDDYQSYIYELEYSLPIQLGTIIARFSGGFTPGDIDGNGSVTVADAITALRLAMGLLDGSGMNTDAADMDGNGSITIADAIVILRTAMGLA